MTQKIVTSTIISLLIVSISIFAVAKKYSQPSQVQNTTNQIPQKANPPGTIDGAKTPDLIPDAKAYEIFLLSVAIPPISSEFEKSSAKSKFKRAELEDSDTEAVMKILDVFYSKWQHIVMEEKQLREKNATDKEFNLLQEKANKLMEATRLQFASQLSQKGNENLHSHIIGLKQKIKIFTQPNI